MAQTISETSRVGVTAERNSLPPSSLYRTPPIPPSDYIRISDLAVDLDVSPKRLKSLVRHKYVRVIESAGNFADTLVAKPLPAAMDWLRSMYAPIAFRPFIPIAQVASLLETSADEVRRTCLRYNIPLTQDIVFGELLSPNRFYDILRNQQAERDPMRYDSQRLLFMHMVLAGATDKKIDPLPYHKRIGREITRICKMKEPVRTMRGGCLVMAYNEATTIADCFARYKENVAVAKENAKTRKILDKRIVNIDKAIMGEDRWGTVGIAGWRFGPGCIRNREARRNWNPEQKAEFGRKMVALRAAKKAERLAIAAGELAGESSASAS